MGVSAKYIHHFSCKVCGAPREVTFKKRLYPPNVYEGGTTVEISYPCLGSCGESTVHSLGRVRKVTSRYEDPLEAARLEGDLRRAACRVTPTRYLGKDPQGIELHRIKARNLVGFREPGGEIILNILYCNNAAFLRWAIAKLGGTPQGEKPGELREELVRANEIAEANRWAHSITATNRSRRA